MKFKLNKYQFLILLLSILFVLPSWLFSYYQYPNEDLILKILNDTVDTLYYTLAVNYSDFNFKPVYELNSNEITGIAAYPILTVFIISFFWKIIGPYSFPLIQLLSTFIVLLIFYNFAVKSTINKFSSFFISIFCVTFVFFFEYIFNAIDIKFLQTIYNNLANFYYYRFPRPIITNLFLFSYIYICFKVFYKDNYKLKYFVYLGVISGITLHLFYFFFVTQNILLFFLILKRFGFNKSLFEKQNLKVYLVYLFFLFIFLFLFFLNSSLADSDYLIRLGPIDINFEKRIILFEYYYEFIVNKIFIVLFIINIIVHFINKFYFKLQIFEYLCLIFYASILSPIIFFILTPKVITLYHFFNWILIFGTLNIIFSSLYFLGKFLNTSLKKFLQIVYIFLSLIVVNYKLISTNITVQEQRINLSEITNYLSLNKQKLLDKKFLVPDYTVFAWLSINKFNNFDYVPVEMWTTRSNDRLEKDKIKMFKFFDLNKNDFKNYIKNQRSDFRMMNPNAYNFLGRKYIANKLKTFENTNDYENYNFIKSIKPTISHSFAIPRYEINRLLEKFENTNEKIKPDYIIINKDSYFKFKNNNKKDYCTLKENKTYIVYSIINCE